MLTRYHQETRGADLLDMMDEGSRKYIFTFFFDEGKPELSLLVKGSKDLMTSDCLIDAFKDSLKPALYNKLVEHAAYYAPPYLLLNEFAKEQLKEPFATFLGFQWQEPGAENKFENFLKNKFPSYNESESNRMLNTLNQFR